MLTYRVEDGRHYFGGTHCRETVYVVSTPGGKDIRAFAGDVNGAREFCKCRT